MVEQVENVDKIIDHRPPLIVLAGPTAVGKTKLSLALAHQVNGSIISADSMQIYKKMDIGTAKIHPDEMEGVKHYLVDQLNPDEPFHVVRFQEMALAAMEEIYNEGKVPIIVGGTGFYIQALVKKIDFTDTMENGVYRSQLETIAKDGGIKDLWTQLNIVDPDSAKVIHVNNVKRVIRALEFFHETGQPISKHNEEQKSKSSPYNYAYFVLNDYRDKVYKQIDLRVDQMIKDGLIEEVQSLLDSGYYKGMVAMEGLGYKEIIDYLENKCSLEEAIYTVKRDTRHFAKRQITWFKREKDVLWFPKYEYQYKQDEIIKKMLEKLKQRGIIHE